MWVCSLIINILKNLMGMPTSTILWSLPFVWLLFSASGGVWSYAPSHHTVIHQDISQRSLGIWRLSSFQPLHAQLLWQLLPSIALHHFLKSCNCQWFSTISCTSQDIWAQKYVFLPACIKAWQGDRSSSHKVLGLPVPADALGNCPSSPWDAVLLFAFI